MKNILVLFVALFFVIGFGGTTEVRAEEPTLAQCQGEPSKGTGWGTFWTVIGGLNAVGGGMMIGSPDTYEDLYEKSQNHWNCECDCWRGFNGFGYEYA